MRTSFFALSPPFILPVWMRPALASATPFTAVRLLRVARGAGYPSARPLRNSSTLSRFSTNTLVSKIGIACHPLREHHPWPALQFAAGRREFRRLAINQVGNVWGLREPPDACYRKRSAIVRFLVRVVPSIPSELCGFPSCLFAEGKMRKNSMSLRWADLSEG